jgi:hypothetical protein
MDLVTELLASAHEADVERVARARQRQSLVETCRRRWFGLLPIGPACEPNATC